MKKLILRSFIFILFIQSHFLIAQEWKDIKSYQKETGNTSLIDGNWLKKDRKKQTHIWKQANKYNLSLKNGNNKYKTVNQIRDFYLWFDEEIKNQGYEIKWFGIAPIAANQISKANLFLIRVFIIRNNELISFLNNGSKKVFSYAFTEMEEIYFSNEIIKGKDAEKWDAKYGLDEQCIILEPLYNDLSEKSIKKLERMAKRKGIFYFGIPKSLEFEGDIKDCKTRFNHGVNKLQPFYLENN